MAIKELFFEGKTIDLAVEAAAAALGEDKDLLIYTVEETPTKGFLGIGATNAKIKVEQEVPDEEAPAEKNKKPEIPAWEPEKLSGKGAKAAGESKKSDGPARENRKPRKEAPVSKKAVSLEPPVEKNPVDDAVSQKLTSFLTGLLKQIGAEEESAVKVELGEENHYYAEVSGAKMGVLIGRRGETLDAVQYLCSLVVNKGTEEKIRVTVDTENYRSKRIRTLENLADRTAEKAMKYRRNITMEPMNPYERRVIHAALTGREHITTYSVGSEPKRRVVVSYKK